MWKKTKSFVRSKFSWGIVAIVSFYFAIEVIWKELFFVKNVSGPYWVYIFTDKTTLYLPLIFFVFFVATCIANYRHPNYVIIVEVGLFSIIGTIFVLFIYLYGVFPDGRYAYHLAELRTEEKVYYLAAYEVDSISVQYKLYECDSLGVFCKLRYKSDWYDDGNHLVYEYGEIIHVQKEDKIIVKAFVESEETEIYEFTLLP